MFKRTFCQGVNLVRLESLSVPPLVQNGTVPHVVLDCPFSLGEEEKRGMVLKEHILSYPTILLFPAILPFPGIFSCLQITEFETLFILFLKIFSFLWQSNVMKNWLQLSNSFY